MNIDRVELVTVRLPLMTPWHTGAGRMEHRDLLMVHVRSDVGEGWGECAAFTSPFYSSEYIDSARQVLDRHLIPPLLPMEHVSTSDLGTLWSHISGHQMAKSALEMALLDIELRHSATSLASEFGVTRTHVEAGIALGFAPSAHEMVEHVSAAIGDGYRRIKIKVAPTRDIDVLEAVREAFPSVRLQVDANGAYGPDDVDHLTRFDEFNLACIEQPFADDDHRAHAELAERMNTPICLDEPIVSLATTVTAVEFGACSVVNLKPGRVGGYLEAKRIHDWCSKHRVALWCGGMLESGLARSANISLAALNGFTLTGDLSASARFYEHDIVTKPVDMVDGYLTVPQSPGIGATINPEAIDRFRLATLQIDA